jgi:TRIC channel
MVLKHLVQFLTADFPFSNELQCLWMAYQGAMSVRNGPNFNRQMHWFHAFCVSVIAGYGGSLFAPLWMGRPTSLFSNDLSLPSCIIGFVAVNYFPFDIGYKLGNTLPVALITGLFAQLFRTMGIVKFVEIAYHAFKDTPSVYYPTPIFGPIVWATLLGNMGSFFLKGFNGHLEKGMPWAFQNGFFCATLYHFFVFDQKGFIGIAFRNVVHSMPFIQLGLSDPVFAVVFVSAFMQIVGILQLPHFLGPAFSPFNSLYYLAGSILSFLQGSRTNLEELKSDAPANGQTNGAVTDYTKKKRNRTKSKTKIAAKEL